MKLYHVLVEQEDDWFIGRVLEREGVTTQGRSLDELVFMLRDAILLMWREKDVQLELFVPQGMITSFERKKAAVRKARYTPREGFGIKIVSDRNSNGAF